MTIGDGLSPRDGRQSAGLTNPALKVTSQYRGMERGWQQIEFATFSLCDEEIDIKVAGDDDPFHYEDPYSAYIHDLAAVFLVKPHEVQLNAYGSLATELPKSQEEYVIRSNRGQPKNWDNANGVILCEVS